MKINFDKMSGTGNDFLVIDNRNKNINEGQVTDFAVSVCPRKTAIGADGVILLEESDCADFKMRIINSDGSEAEMCGNGARCAADFAFRKNIADNNMTFETLAGIIKAEITDNPKVRLTDTEKPEFIESFDYCSRSDNIYYLNTGVPHTVIAVEDIEKIKISEWGRAIRMHEKFSPAGTNVNFISRKNDSEIILRTYERGVEAETLACGTGAAAAAVTASIIWNMHCPITVNVRSGEKLKIYFTAEGDKFTDIYLEGPVKTVYQGCLEF
ncbi:MAG: diaminopimelate epimerase [Planctomycetota bacterium]|jgi:diaminopimelate epimerase